MDFIYAAELKKRFACYGHFYEWELLNGDRVRCRSVLEIVDQSIPQEQPSEISLMSPDAVVIMMNPGSSHPKEVEYIPSTICYPQQSTTVKKELVLTQPDNTQYQIMRVAVSQDWAHIRVVNLSDLRDPKSGSFLQKVGELRELIGGHVHSIFCEERTDECAHALTRNGKSPILLGWGQDRGLLPLAEQCMRRIASEPVVTCCSPVHSLLNAHPSPMMQRKKEEWLERILCGIAEANERV